MSRDVVEGLAPGVEGGDVGNVQVDILEPERADRAPTLFDRRRGQVEADEVGLREGQCLWVSTGVGVRAEEVSPLAAHRHRGLPKRAGARAMIALKVGPPPGE